MFVKTGDGKILTVVKSSEDIEQAHKLAADVCAKQDADAAALVEPEQVAKKESN